MKHKHRTRITRKEIAFLIDSTVDVVAYNEARWGLDKIRVTITCRNVSYWEAEAMAILRARGLLKVAAG